MPLAIGSLRPVFLALPLLSACGTGAPESEEPEAPVGFNVGKPWMPPAQSVEAMQVAADTRETIRYVTDGGHVDVVGRFDGTRRTFGFDVELAAIRVADVPTLEYPAGWVRLDTLSLTGEPAGWIKPITSGLLRSLGAPIQLVFDVQSIGAFTGRLREPGARIEAQILGRLQIGDRALDVSFPGVVTRPDADRLEVTIGAFDVPLDEVALGDAVDQLEKALRVRRIDHTVSVSGRVALTRLADGALPSFVRTPLTIQSVDEVRAKLDAAVDRSDVQRIRLERTGYEEDALRYVPEDALRRLEEARRAKQEGRASVFENMELPAEQEIEEPQRRGYIVVQPE